MADDSIYPIELKQVIFTNVCVLAIPDHQPATEFRKSKASLSNNINIELLNEELKEYAVSMTSQFNLAKDPMEPYAIDVSCIGIFQVVDPEMSAEEAIKAISMTGHSVVYGAIRETVAWITSRSIFGLFTFGISVLKPQPNPNPKAAAKK